MKEVVCSGGHIFVKARAQKATRVILAGGELFVHNGMGVSEDTVAGKATVGGRDSGLCIDREHRGAFK